MAEDTFHLGIKALVRNKQGAILLLKINPAELKKFTGKPYWDLPGGRIHRGITVEETLKREIDEEIGVKKINSIELLTMVISNIRIPVAKSDVGLILAIYDCRISRTTDFKLSFEHTEAKWFTPKEAGELLKIKYPKEFSHYISSLEKNNG